jgi:hypothetical protein
MYLRLFALLQSGGTTCSPSTTYEETNFSPRRQRRMPFCLSLASVEDPSWQYNLQDPGPKQGSARQVKILGED